MINDEQKYLQQKASNGCSLIIPTIALVICRFIVGMPKDASKGGLIAYLIILILCNIFMLGSAKGAKQMGMQNATSLFLLEFFVCLGLTIYIIVLMI